MLRNFFLLLAILLGGCETLNPLPDAARPPIPREQPLTEQASQEEAAQFPMMDKAISLNAAKSLAVKREKPAESAVAARYESVQAKFIKGSAAYQIPPVMVEDSPSPVDLWIDAGASNETIKSKLKEYLNENLQRTAERFGQPIENVKVKSIGTDIVAKSVLIGKKMFAELTGEGFSFDKTGPQEQTFIEGQPLRWSWLVTPKRPGDDLILKLEVRADPGEGQTPVVTIREYVRVNARPLTCKEKFERIEWWVKALTGMGISGLIASIYKLVKKKQENNNG